MVRDFTGTNPGSYRISVQRLNNPVGCTALSYGGAPTEKTTSYAAEMDCLTFTGANLDDIRIRIIKTAGNLQPVTEVVRTDGTTKCTNDSNVDQTCTLDSGGTHRIIVRDAAGPETGTYRIQIQRLNNPGAGTCPAIVAGAGIPTLGNITTRPELDCFTYNATTASQKLRVRVVETGSTPTLTAMIEVVRPNGTSVCTPTGAIEVTCALDTAGNHRIIVRDFTGQSTGTYRIAVQRLDNPVGCTALSYGGAPTEKTTSYAAEMDCLTFTGANLDDIRIRIIKTAGNLQPVTEVVRTDGTTKCTNDSNVDQTCTLDSGGTHRIIVRDAAGPETGTYRIQIQRLNNPGAGTCPAIVAGAGIPTLGNITTRPELDCFTYNATTASQKLRVRVVETGSTPTLTAMIEVVRPNGTSVCTPTGAIEVTCALDTAGNHRIIVRDFTGQSTGTYRIAVQRLDNPVGCTALSYGGAPTEKTTSYAAEMDCLTFTGANLDDIRIRIIKTAGNLQPVTEVVRTDGTTKCTNDSNVDQTCTLDSGGTHRIIVRDAAGPETGTYRIQIQRLNNPGAGTCPAIVAGAGIPTLGNITTRPELDCFTYNATTASQKLRVRVVETGSTPTLTAMIEVVRPNGTSVCTPTGAIEVTCALDTAGNHRIIVRDFTGQSTGTYRIAVQRLDNPVGCTALSYGGAPTEKTTSYAAEMDCLTFTGANLDDIRIRIIKTAGNLQPVTEVVRTDGTTKCTNDSNVDQTCTLDSGGTHRIIVRDAAGPETGTYRIQIQRLNNPGAGTCPAISLGATGSAGNIVTRPELDCFTYNATTAAQKLRVRVAEKGASPTLTAMIEVVRPNGTTVCTPTGATEVNCNLDATGNHRIIVRDFTGQSTGTYGISARRLNGPAASCEVLTAAASVIRPITEAAEQDCYAFTGQNGETYPIEMSGMSGFTPSIEVLRPNGTTVCGPGDSTLNSCLFDTTGTHQFIVRDGSGPGTGTGNYFLAVG